MCMYWFLIAEEYMKANGQRWSGEIIEHWKNPELKASLRRLKTLSRLVVAVPKAFVVALRGILHHSQDRMYFDFSMPTVLTSGIGNERM